MRDLVENHRSHVDTVIGRVAKFQTVLAVVGAVGISALSEYVNARLGFWAITLTLVSIPSIAWYGKWRVRVFEKRSWAKQHPNLDFSGHWVVETEFLHAVMPSQAGTMPPGQTGDVILAQTPFELKLVGARLKCKERGQPVGGWKWLAGRVSDDGESIHTVFVMDDLPDAVLRKKRSHGHGYEHIRVTAWEANDHRRRPSEMEGYWYDCIRLDSTEPLYIGRTRYKRKA